MELPKISSVSRTSINPSNASSFRDSATIKLKDHIVRKLYVSRKINSEELHRPNEAELPQIKEEKIGRSQIVSSTDADESDLNYELEEEELQNNQDQMNIFKVEMLYSPKFKFNKGPVYKNEKIVRHSLLGSINTFENYKRSLNKQYTGIDDDLLNPHLMKRASYIQNYEPTNNLSREVSNSSEATTTTTHFCTKRGSIRKSLKEKTKEPKEIALSKEDLQSRIEQMHNSQEGFYQTQAQEYASLPLRDRLKQTREERCMKKFTEVAKSWETRTFNIAKIVGRQPETSVMQRSETHRQKKEIVDFLEINKTEKERLGDSYWNQSLRNYQSFDNVKQASSRSPLKGVPGMFATIKSHRNQTPFQVIRKTGTSADMYSTVRNWHQPKQIDRTSREYLETKFITFNRNSKLPNPFENQLESLTVEGKNKLDMEATVVMPPGDKTQTFYFPKKYLKGKSSDLTSTILEERYNKTPLPVSGIAEYF